MTAVDRRTRRRRQTIEEILDVAIEVMGEDGVAGLSLAEVARRMGVQPPSLYEYFPSKMALYDALFAEGARRHAAATEAGVGDADHGLAALRAGTEASMRWVVDNPVLAQLLYWRPVPGFEPSDEAFGPAVAYTQRLRELLAEAVGRGELHPDAASDAGVSLFTAMFAGLMSQQLANEPGAPFERGRFTTLLPEGLAMFIRYYARTEEP